MFKFFIPFFFFLSLRISGQEIEKTNTSEIDSVQKMHALDEVQIRSSNLQSHKYGADKTTIRIKNNAVLNSGSTFEAVRRISGVIVSPTGTLALNGKNVIIYIDGSPTALSGTDLQVYLASLPANLIEKLELIYNPDASYDAKSNGAIINIVTQSKRTEGIHSSVQLNAVWSKYPKVNSQITLNGKINKLSWQTALGLNYNESRLLIKNKQTFTAQPGSYELFQQKNNLFTNRSSFFRLGTNYELTSKSNLLFNYNGNFENGRTIYETLTQGPTIDYATIGNTVFKSTNHETSFQYNTQLDTQERRLSITAYTNLFSKKPHTKLIDETGFLSTGNNKFNLNNKYVKFDFDLPFQSPEIVIRAGGKYSDLNVSNDGIYSRGNSLQKINFDYSENTIALYLEANKKIKKISIGAGVRFEDFSVTKGASTLKASIKLKNTGFFPHTSITYAYNDNLTSSLSYSKKITQPNHTQLDPNNSDGFDRYNTSEGNLLLKPTFSDHYDFTITAFNYINLAVNYEVTKNSVFAVYNAPSDGQLISNLTFQQYSKFDIFSANLSFPVPLDYFLKSKKVFEERRHNMDQMNNVFFNINYVKSFTSSEIATSRNTSIFNYSAQAQLFLPANIKANVNYILIPKGGWQIYSVNKPIQSLDLSFSRNFIKDRLSVGLHVVDLFNTNSTEATIYGRNLTTNFYKKEDTRMFKISLNYNLGNFKAAKKNTEIETDKPETGGGLVR